MTTEKVYIGDAVYAKKDDFGGVWLTTESGTEVTNSIYLEPDVYSNLKLFVERGSQE